MVNTGFERRHRLLEDERNLGAADLLHLPLLQREEIASLEHDPAARDPARPLHEPENGERRHRFSAPRLADQAQGLARVHVEADVNDGRGNTTSQVEYGRQVLNA